VWLALKAPDAARLSVDTVMFCVIGWAQYSVGNAMHEAVHHNLCNRRGDLLASVLTAWPIGLTMRYRGPHLAHHRFLGTTQDPDYPMYTRFPRSKFALALRLLWFVSGVPAAIQFLGLRGSRDPAVIDAPRTRKSARQYADLLGFGATQVAILGLFWLTFGTPIFYLLFWCLPIATVGKLLSSTRFLCEHGSPNREWVVRTIHGQHWQTWVMGAYDFNYHGEHHLFPYVPFAHLRRLHMTHREYAARHPEYLPLEGKLETYDGGYLSLLAHWFRVLPWHRASSRRAQP
jgi:fatty acid desaturase